MADNILITAEQVRERLDAGEKIVFLDVRDPAAWEQSSEQIPGSVRMTLDSLGAQARSISQDTPLVTYCAAKTEGPSARAARELSDAGFQDVRALIGGFDAWTEAGYELELKHDMYPTV